MGVPWRNVKTENQRLWRKKSMRDHHSLLCTTIHQNVAPIFFTYHCLTSKCRQLWSLLCVGFTTGLKTKWRGTGNSHIFHISGVFWLSAQSLVPLRFEKSRSGRREATTWRLPYLSPHRCYTTHTLTRFWHCLGLCYTSRALALTMYGWVLNAEIMQRYISILIYTQAEGLVQVSVTAQKRS